MFQRIVGLDIGSYSMKAVYVQRGFKGFSIERCLEWPIASPGSDQAPIHFHQVLAEGFQKAGIRSAVSRDLVVASLPQRFVFTHFIRLPFTDPQQVAQTVAYEMEGQIPLDLEEVVVDYHPIQSATGDTTVLALAVSRENLKRYLEEFHKAGVDPKAFEVDSLALFNFYQQYLKGEAGDMALLDLGASKTSVCIVGEENPRWVRTLWFGGHHLTRGIAQALKISPGEAEEEKKKAHLTLGDQEEDRLSGVIKETLEPFLKELTTTFHVYETESQREIRKIYVCGGTSRLQGLASYLAHHLGKGLVQGPGIAQEETFAVGIGLALKEHLGSKGSRIRFRSGEFAYGKEQAQTRQRVWILGIAGAVLLFLLGGDLYLRYHLKESRYRELQSHVRSIFQQTFPSAKAIVNEVEQTKAAQKEIEKRAAFFGSGTVTALDFLQEITHRMPTDRVIEVQDLLIEQGSIRIEAQADTFESVERFKEALSKYESFKEVAISDAKTSADQSKVRFRISISLVVGL